MTAPATPPIPSPSTDPHQSPVSARGRVAWLAGTRGEWLTLAPLWRAFEGRDARTGAPLHQLLSTSEQGMALQQAMDWLAVYPHEAAPLCHPADEPPQRIGLMLERAEAFSRQHRLTHLVFSGCGPTALGAALLCHARGCRGLWIAPADPARLIDRLRLESGYRRVIEACAPLVEVVRPSVAVLLPDDLPAGFEAVERGAVALDREVPGRRPGAPLVLVAVLRREWGIKQRVTDQLSRQVGQWGRQCPDADFLVISNLNARLEGPLRSMPGRPANLLHTPPLPMPVYRAALAEARLALTDSAGIAGEALRLGCPVAALADHPAEGPSVPGVTPILAEDLAGADVPGWLTRALTGAVPTIAPPAPPAPGLDLRAILERFCASAAAG